MGIKVKSKDERYDLIFNDKIITGLNVNEWLTNIKRSDFLEIADDIQDVIISNEIQTVIQQEYAFEEVASAIRHYIQHMSDGKILFKP